MNILMQQIFIILMYRINWKKLLILFSIITTAGVFFQIHILSYPLNLWVYSPEEMISSNKTWNPKVHLKEINQHIVQFENIENLHLAAVVSHNLSMSSNQSVPIVEDEDNVTTQKDIQQKGKDLAMVPNEELNYAKQQMNNISSVVDNPDPDLYAPIFRNVSTFQRSYELMEGILKVYIYKDGKRPIFHQPYLQGIYSSEGWFMKLMEGNKQFVTKEPEKAHLFYLPYSARQLQIALYVPDSHNMKQLSIFLRDYVNRIAAKYPFWNRTHGSDHFLVACHDWGPYTLKEHEELTKNTIKALCNADSSEGIFIQGKDVSLPETTIRNRRRPLRGIGGNKVSKRPILAFFAGHMHGRVRPILHEFWHEKDKDMRIYGLLPKKKAMSYVEHMKSSRYCLCPMGYEVNSPRIVEAIYYECVPVIIADNFVPPMNEVLEWNAFSVRVAEKEIPRLKEILMGIPMKKYVEMRNNVKMVQKHFHWNGKDVVRYDLFHMILHSIWYARLNQLQVTNDS
ncbi:probable glycosyltransferase At5g03795 [Impatiens glandulifera]|uniref:probable glycosyltransferase At5g03795 n=1 Tax=Impatiens glandulifera TaxID=253017 RepID=UPI001FB13275|nr:probable glycosyltransferase At5g03795 [Impatiens glandulifera]XP_047330010.1 probable glycosyltransferase At5g03795 [Impatiens glandulifera]XP_047330011.1 probable glycosyltransferase At5g03795 [Impatiens glandulifera]